MIAGLDQVSGGCFTRGPGARGPRLQVIEDFHGLTYDEPPARTRGIVEICRTAWRRAHGCARPARRLRGTPSDTAWALQHPSRPPLGKPGQVSLIRAAVPPPERGTGCGNRLTKVWQPVFFHPDRADGLSPRPSPRAWRVATRHWAHCTIMLASVRPPATRPPATRPPHRRPSVRISLFTSAEWVRAARTSATT
ncbi:hypothetical protein [Streptomyces flaveolus]|uniref:hypothetical protein n=1 Tax=Streptomyces flaveolus TaxID=67297 RepID=UPI0033F561F5